MNDTDLRANLLMFEAVLILLIDRARAADPDFDDFAQRHFDILLGMFLEETQGNPGEVERKAREYFLALLRTSWGDLRIDPAYRPKPQSPPKPLTWRRRFLNWLERG